MEQVHLKIPPDVTPDVTPEQANATQAAAASVGLANAAENSSSPTADGKTKVVVPEPDQPHNTKGKVKTESQYNPA